SADERFQQHPRSARFERWLQRRRADARFYAGNGLGWRGGAVLAWSGMRGVVTLAAAQSLPTDFPYRTQLVLVAFVVALVTLVGQGGTLPLLIRVLGIRGNDEEQARRELALLLVEINEAAAGQVLDNPDLRRRGGEHFDPGVLEKVREVQARIADPQLRRAAEDPVKSQYAELMQLILDAQQDALNEARSTGSYDSSTIKTAQKRLDQGSVRASGT
ncbi:MAG: cation:proton antiporter domain-containing protein, partial [Brachybacterium tyrofermentans]